MLKTYMILECYGSNIVGGEKNGHIKYLNLRFYQNTGNWTYLGEKIPLQNLYLVLAAKISATKKLGHIYCRHWYSLIWWYFKIIFHLNGAYCQNVFVLKVLAPRHNRKKLCTKSHTGVS